MLYCTSAYAIIVPLVVAHVNSATLKDVVVPALQFAG